jgi:segregation and condensation protein B
MTMDPSEAKRILEALLFVYGESLPMKRITDILPDVSAPQLRQLVETLNAEYAASQRVFRIQELGGSYQLVTDPQLAPWVKRALERSKPDAVSTAAMETLAIIAYRQPITKAEIEAIRGVDGTASLDTLLEKQFVRVAGRKDSPGRPFLYGTTMEFLRHFGLRSLEALPPMAMPSIPEQTSAEATAASPAAAPSTP